MGLIRKYWYIAVALGVIALYYLYTVYKNSSLAASSTDLSSETQFQQLQTAQQLQQAQYQSQLDLVGAQAQAQTQVIAASAQGQVDLANVGANTYNNYLNTQVTLNQQNNQTAEDISSIQAGTYLNLAQTQADVYKSQIAVQQSAQDTLDSIVSANAKSTIDKWGYLSTPTLNATAAALQGNTPQYVSAAAQVAAATQGGFQISIPGVGAVGYKG